MNNKYITELSRVVSSLKDESQVKGFLKQILTPSELDEIAVRLQIFKMLIRNVPQRTIAKMLNVSLGTISRGSREIKYGKGDIKKILK